MANLKYFLWLTQRKGFQSGETGELLSRFGTPEAVYFAKGPEYESLGLSGIKKRALEDKDLSGAEKILEDCARENIGIMTIQDADYPERLAQIYDPPCVLYWKGKALNVDDCLTLGVVGTRKSTPYGEGLAFRLGLDLARSGAVLVSGMAEGIDSAGLRGALKGGGRTISVLAGGLDVIYPKKNYRLYEDVAVTGTLVSEYPPGTEHAGYHFPIRNRIISGLSMGVVVVEAGDPSGALITARTALEQNREVFAFPGPVGGEASRGCHRLIRRGEARLVTSAEEVLEEFQFLFPHRAHLPPPMAAEELEQRLENREARPAPEGEAQRTEAGASRERVSLSEAPEAFTDDERDILRAIERRSLTVDDISEQAQIPARRVLSALTMLQLRGMVEEKPGKRFYAAIILTA